MIKAVTKGSVQYPEPPFPQKINNESLDLLEVIECVDQSRQHPLSLHLLLQPGACSVYSYDIYSIYFIVYIFIIWSILRRGLVPITNFDWELLDLTGEDTKNFNSLL